MSIHETPPKIRRSALSEVARVLKPGGIFVLVESCRPRLGLLGILWYPLVCFGEKNKDNWCNVYPDLCRDRGLMLESDAYLNSISRRQVFIK